jgi:flagellar FliL protein
MAEDRDEDDEAQAEKSGGGLVKTLGSAAGIFVIVLAAQIVAPAINRLIYGDPAAAVAEADGEAAAEGEAEAEAVDLTQLDPPLYTPLDPPLIVPFEDETGTRFLQLSLEVMARSQKAIDAVETHRPAIRNDLILMISGKNWRELNTVPGKERLRADALGEVQRIMVENTGEPAVEAVYFTNFVIQ